MKPRCEARVPDKQSSMYREHQCRNPAKVTRHGKSYCGQHDPKVRAARSAAADKFFRDKQNARRRDLENQRIGAAYRALFLDGVSIDYIMEQVNSGKKRRTL